MHRPNKYVQKDVLKICLQSRLRFKNNRKRHWNKITFLPSLRMVIGQALLNLCCSFFLMWSPQPPSNVCNYKFYLLRIVGNRNVTGFSLKFWCKPEAVGANFFISVGYGVETMKGTIHLYKASLCVKVKFLSIRLHKRWSESF